MSPRIQVLVTQFVESLTAAIQEEGAAAFKAAIAGEHEVGNGRRSFGGQVGNGGRKPGPKPKPAVSRAKGVKRSPGEIESLTKSLLAAIKRKPGQRIEEIGKGMSVNTKELALPVSKLFDAKVIRTTGTRRATKYFPR